MLHDITSIIGLLFLVFSPDFCYLEVSLGLLVCSPGSHKQQIPAGMRTVGARLLTGASGVVQRIYNKRVYLVNEYKSTQTSSSPVYSI